eukprot:GHVT01002837.1.p1 GENE.GHVT01002837.1~~GHVT01002837.1.p1  ORF type:complete len:586 (-),score=53.97 GHVT01002837.1:1082-2737(-)
MKELPPSIYTFPLVCTALPLAQLHRSFSPLSLSTLCPCVFPHRITEGRFGGDEVGIPRCVYEGATDSSRQVFAIRTAALGDATDELCCTALSDDGQTAAAGGCDESCRVYHVEHQLPGVADPLSCTCSPENQETRAAAAAACPVCRPIAGGLIWQPLSLLDEAKDTIACAAFSRDGKYLATGSLDDGVRIYQRTQRDLSRPNEQPGFSLLHTFVDLAGEVEFVTWHPRGPALLAGGSVGTAALWWAPTGETMATFAGLHGTKLTAGTFACSGKKVVTVGQDSSLGIWDPTTGALTSRLTSRSGHVTAQSSSSHSIPWHSSPIVCLDAQANGSLVCTGSEDGTARLVNVDTGKIVSMLGGHTNTVEAVAFCHSASVGNLGRCGSTGQPGSAVAATLLATADLDGNVQIWDTNGGKLRSAMKHGATPVAGSQPAGVTRLRWHPDGHPLLATGGTDGHVHLWDCRAAQCVGSLKAGGDEGFIMDLNISALAGSTPQQAAECKRSTLDSRLQLAVAQLERNTASRSSSPHEAFRLVAADSKGVCSSWDVLLRNIL